MWASLIGLIYTIPIFFTLSAFVETENDNVDTSVDYPKCPSPTPPMPPPKPGNTSINHLQAQVHTVTYLSISTYSIGFNECLKLNLN